MIDVRTAVLLLVVVTLPTGSGPAADGLGGMLDNPLAARSLDTFPQTRLRPLFSPGRRPVPGEAPPAVPVPRPSVVSVPAPLPETRFDLVGIAGSGTARLAVLRVERGDLLRLREGETVDGWQVRRIEPRQVVLARGSREQTLTLFTTPPAR